MIEKQYLDMKKIIREGLNIREEYAEKAEKFMETIVLMTLSSEYGFMLNEVQKTMGVNRNEICSVYDGLRDLGIIKTVPDKTGPDRAGSATIRLNFASPFWSLKPSDVCAYLNKYPPRKIAQEEFWAINMAMVREDCPPGEGADSMDALLEKVKQEFVYEEEVPLAFVGEICFFIRKRSVYDPEKNGGSVPFEALHDFFVKWGYGADYLEETMKGMIATGVLERSEDGKEIFAAYTSACEIYRRL
jgi:hypothetical protein